MKESGASQRPVGIGPHPDFSCVDRLAARSLRGFVRWRNPFETHSCVHRYLGAGRPRCRDRVSPGKRSGEAWAVRWRPRRRRPWGGGRSSRAHEAAVALGGRSPRRVGWRDCRIRGRRPDRRDASPHCRNTPSDLWVEQRRITSGFGGGTRLAAEFLSACRLATSSSTSRPARTVISRVPTAISNG